MSIISSVLSGKNILITGGSGSLGTELSLILSRNNKVVAYARNEEKLFQLSQTALLNNINNLEIFVGDIQDRHNLSRALKGIDVVIHAAAMKDLIYCESNPDQASKNNVIGSQILLDCISSNPNVKSICAISTDKAVSPSSVYGATKLIMESMFLNFAKINPERNTTIARFGNMIDSKGSLIPLWTKNPDSIIGIGDLELSRYFFKLEEATSFVINLIQYGSNGTINVPLMKKIFIREIIEILNHEKLNNIIGLSIGEKISEELMTLEEYKFATLKRNYYEINRNAMPKKQGLDSELKKEFDQIATEVFTKEELKLVLNYLET